MVETQDGRTAVELEFSPKTPHRLKSIVRGYRSARSYDFVDFVVLPGREHHALRDRIDAIVEAEKLGDYAYELLGLAAPTNLRVVTWRDPYPRLHAGIAPFPLIVEGDAAGPRFAA